MTLEVAGYRKHALLTDPRRCNCCGRCVEACPVGGVTGVTERINKVYENNPQEEDKNTLVAQLASLEKEDWL
jgi:formate hydrogenlyase subunit 6/NADH:ubiquinone oxidoreductase subunit I